MLIFFESLKWLGHKLEQKHKRGEIVDTSWDKSTKEEELLAFYIFIYTLHAGYFFMILLLSADFLSKNLSGTKPRWLTVWIQIKPNILLVLIWLQTVCKCHQMTKVAASTEKPDHGLPLSCWKIYFTGLISGLISRYFQPFPIVN